jgi:uncharacterized protein (DUF433 family)
MTTETKRQNFNITPEQESELNWLRDAIGAPSTKEAILRAVRVMAVLAREVRRGHTLFLRSESGQMTQILIPELQPLGAEGWRYLISRPHPWRRQLYVKGRKLSAYTVWMDMQANQMTPEAAAANWDLPLEAIIEIIRYCETQRELLSLEAAEEHRRLAEEGLSLEPLAAHR